MPSKPTTTPLVAEFQKLVHRKAKFVDPENTQDWYSIALGFALHAGLPPAKAHAFALHIRYHTNLG